MTINDIKKRMRADGSHWFDPDTMQFFGTEIASSVYKGPGGIFFVTEDDQYRRELPKVYTIRQYDPEKNDIETVDRRYKHKDEARQTARDLAGGRDTDPEPDEPYVPNDATESEEPYVPVTQLEQFLAVLDAHSCDPSRVTSTDAKRLMTHAKRHHHLMELLCSNEEFCSRCDSDGSHPQIVDCRERCRQAAKRLGAKSVTFSGDPRGCTVKLVFEDGHTNDWGKEGYCVPFE